MLHLTVLVPADLTDQVLDVLTDDEAVTGLALLRGAAIKPEGDIITADLAREGANAVIDTLRDLGVHRRGTLSIQNATTWMSAAGYQAERATPGSSADAVVWAEVTQRSYEDSEFNWTFASFLTLATVLAAIGILTDSQILVIGAMVLGPEFGAIAALGLALVRRRRRLLTRALATLVGGFALAITVTAGLALIARAVGLITPDQVLGPRPDTSFIYTPNIWSFVVAVIAAAAGVLSLTSSKVGGLSGVFISVTTVPAAGNVALAAVFGDWAEMWGSAQQLGINIAGMGLAGAIVLALQQILWARVSAARFALLGRLSRRRRAGQPGADSGRTPSTSKDSTA